MEECRCGVSGMCRRWRGRCVVVEDDGKEQNESARSELMFLEGGEHVSWDASQTSGSKKLSVPEHGHQHERT